MQKKLPITFGECMITKVRKWGNSQGLRIPKAVLKAARIDVGDEVDVSVRDGRIIVRPVSNVRGKHDLRELVSRIPKDYGAEELDWGLPLGKEAW